MAFYEILWKKSAKKELYSLDRNVITRIISAVDKLAENAFPSNSRKFLGAEYTHRLRVGQYRIIYTVQQKALIITIIRIAHRKDMCK